MLGVCVWVLVGVFKDVLLHFQNSLPPEKGANSMFWVQIQFRKVPVASDLDQEQLLSKTEGFSGAEVCVHCAISSKRLTKLHVFLRFLCSVSVMCPTGGVPVPESCAVRSPREPGMLRGGAETLRRGAEEHFPTDQQGHYQVLPGLQEEADKPFLLNH